MSLKNHIVKLENLMPKSGEYPVALREAKSLLVQEQPNLIPIYMSGMCINILEARVDCVEDKEMKEVEKKRAGQVINNFRGGIRNIVYGMKEYGIRGYPDLMVMTDDLNSTNPAITNPEFSPFSFEIKPKDFELGLTGRLLKDKTGQQYSETLVVPMDIYDAYNFAFSIRPQKVEAVMPNGGGITIFEADKETGQTEKREFKREKEHYVMDEKQKDHWRCDVNVLPTNGLKVVYPDFYKRIERYEGGTILFGHKFKNIREFLDYATFADNHLIWKICKRDLGDPNRPLIDAGPYYGKYQGKPRYENINRLHFMPGKAHLWFDGVMISFDKPRGIQALMNLGDIVRDIWIDPSEMEKKSLDSAWDIIYDKSRGIIPKKHIRVSNDEEYQAYPVLKN